MVQCDKCCEWFHGLCIGQEKRAEARKRDYLCGLCQLMCVYVLYVYVLSVYCMLEPSGAKIIFCSRSWTPHPLHPRLQPAQHGSARTLWVRCKPRPVVASFCLPVVWSRN